MPDNVIKEFCGTYCCYTDMGGDWGMQYCSHACLDCLDCIRIHKEGEGNDCEECQEMPSPI